MARRDLNRRVDRLEQKSGSEFIVVFGKPGETEAETLRRHGIDPASETRRTVIYLDWEDAAA